MKGLILFRMSDICHNTLGYWMENLTEMFREAGITVYSFALSSDPAENRTLMEQVLSEGTYQSALAFNANAGYILFADLFEKYNITFFNYIVDHPLDHHKALENAFGRYQVICVDKKHKQFIKRYFPKVAKAHFLPLGGMREEGFEPSYEEFAGRPYEVVFTGALNPTDHMVAGLAEYPEDIRNLTFQLIQYMLLHTQMTPEEALAGVLQESYAGLKVSEEQFLQLAIRSSRAIYFVRNYIREEIIQALFDAGQPVHIFGNGWEKLAEKYPAFRAYFHGEVDVLETVHVNQKAKVVLNILPWFKDGTHDRIATAQLNGAVVLTDDNPYLQSLYSDGEDIFFFDAAGTKGLPEIVRRILSDPGEMYKAATAGYDRACRELTWESVAEKLIQIMDT